MSEGFATKSVDPSKNSRNHRQLTEIAQIGRI
ncbi:hypothetical protein NIES4072_35410 [Nostoc commune NIES-4072]|uniref:Uncharacterized protein n=1 Tax=Nostoc commune NIES-4072 TaxID=2005467 RepID=A0A2R5FM69_NOSCO|nr:hypothetical protein NIES4070_55380 [Nostoc commune HK-02]GBG19872.1 hypothetical protein NIES4072_35410 [Nostoc commune NIES-4072]